MPPVNLDPATRKRPDAPAWQAGELQAGIAELDSGEAVSHDEVSEWLKSWGRRGETKAPR
jgi:predicted transcriptional regulator